MKRSPMTRSRPKPGIPAVTRYAIYSRDCWRCQRCGELLDGVPFSIHHRKPRKMGGRHGAAEVAIHDMTALVLLCGSGVDGCHGQVEKERSQAYDDGWLVREHENPATVPCLTYRGWEQPGETWEIA